MSPRSRWLILSLAVLGLVFASSSAWVHYRLMTDPAYVSPCDLNSKFNCSQAYLSPYGSVFGKPVALGGMLWFGLVALVAWFSSVRRGASLSGGPGRSGGSGQPGGAYLFALSTVGLAVVLYFGYTSFFVLKMVCLLCLGTYACVAGLFITSGVSSTMSVSQLPPRFFSDLGATFRKPLGVALALLLLGGIGYAAAVFPREGTLPQAPTTGIPADAVAAFTEAWAQLPRVDLGIPAGGAKVVFVKFNDYECPPCGATWTWYKPVFEKFDKTHPGAVKVVFKDWPWNSRCNFNLGPGSPAHPGACDAAAAVRMAQDRGKAKELEMQEWLYANQTGMSPVTVKAAAERILGLKAKDYDAEYVRKLPGIQKDVADGVALRINSTPTFFINGVRIPEGQTMPPQYLELAIQIELNKAGGK